jgi:hypothetical protein
MVENNVTQYIPEQVQKTFDAVMAFQLPSTDQQFRERINSEIEQEANSSSPLRLNEQGLTNGMLNSCVDPVAELRDNFLKLQGAFDTAIHPFLKRIHALEDTDKQILMKQHEADKVQMDVEKRHEENERFDEAKKNVIRLQEEYEVIRRAEGQREAKDFSTTLYGFLLFGVGAAEWMINYETFLNFTEIPLMAAGATILIALAVAFSAHFHGMMLKGHQHFFDNHLDVAKKNRNFRVFYIVTVMLVLAFFSIGAARYLLVANQVSQLAGNSSGLLGGESITVNVGQIVSISMVINLFVWFVGAAISYATHDENPEFTDKFRECKKAKQIFEPLRIEKESEVVRIRARLEKEIKELRNTAFAHEQETKPLADLLSTITEKNSKIFLEINRLTNRLIRNYRTGLIDQVTVDSSDLKFNNGGHLIDVEVYRQINIDYNFELQQSE